MRLVHDDPENAIRYSLGDINFIGTELQGSPALGGFSIERSYSELQPLRIVAPGGQRSFTLERSARVDVFVNGVLARTLRLAPGNINLQDFPFLDGANDVVLEIEDDAGRRQTIEFTSFFDNELLSQGLSEFSYNIGVPSSVVERELEYEEGNVTFSGFHRYGLSDQITLGLNAQGNDDVYQLGAQYIMATRFGSFNAELSGSRGSNLNDDYDMAANFDYELNFGELNRNEFDVSLNYYGDDFTALSNIDGNNPFRTDLQVRYRTELPYDVGAAWTARHADGQSGQGNIISFGATLNRSFGKASGFFSVDYIDEDGEDEDVRALLSISYRINERQTLLVRQNTLQQRRSVEWTRFERNVANDWGANVAIEDTRDQTEVTGEFEYNANRFEASVEHELLGDSFSGASFDDQRTRLNLASSIVFSGGHFAVGRPVGSSFAIFHKHKSLDDALVAVDVDRFGKARAWADMTGPAVVPDIANYRPEELDINVRGAPVGYDYGPSTHNILTGFGTGTAVRIGSDASVIAVGTLVDANGFVLGLATGKVFREGGAEDKAQVVFSNSDGRFVAQGIAPGRYVLKIRDQNLKNYSGSFIVADDEMGYVKLGEVVLEND